MMIIHRLNGLEKEMKRMADNFAAMTAAIDFVASEVDAIIQIIQNPNVNNNDQPQIDALTARLEGLGNALKAAIPVAPEPAPVLTDTVAKK
jgi:hypothetical protein